MEEDATVYSTRGITPDCFDDSLYNADIQILKRWDNNEWVKWCIIVGRRNLEDGHKVFIRYGKDYWCYLCNINTQQN